MLLLYAVCCHLIFTVESNKPWHILPLTPSESVWVCECPCVYITRMASRMGVRIIHQCTMFTFISQHLQGNKHIQEGQIKLKSVETVRTELSDTYLTFSNR